MKNILNYYYKIIIDDNSINEGYFFYNNRQFYIHEYQRNINEIEALYLLNRLMIDNHLPVNEIIKNTFNQIITNHDNKNYVLIMINYEYQESGKIKFIKSFMDNRLDILKRNDWGKLWSIKIDYLEYQLSHLTNSYPLLNDSINYYIGLSENAISYFNMLDLSNVNLFISHRRINNDNIFNPMELVIDYKARDIAEYIKTNFFNGMSIINIKNYLKKLDLEDIDYILIYVRLLYPSYYFDLYEKIINDKMDEKLINKITNLVNSYEELLYEIYSLFKRKVNIIGIDWINKKYM